MDSKNNKKIMFSVLGKKLLDYMWSVFSIIPSYYQEKIEIFVQELDDYK